jgi:putative heme-binding domain-containing protein
MSRWPKPYVLSLIGAPLLSISLAFSPSLQGGNLFGDDSNGDVERQDESDNRPQGQLILDNDIYVPDERTQALFVLDLEANEDLIRVPRSEFVYVALLTRPGLPERFRSEALAGLAKIRAASPLAVYLAELALIDGHDKRKGAVLDELASMIRLFSAKELMLQREALTALATGGEHPIKRQIGYAGLLKATGSVEPVWNMAAESDQGIQDLLSTVPLVGNPQLERELYPKVRSLLDRATNPHIRHAAIVALVSTAGHEEEEVLSLLANFVQQGTDTDSAIAALRQMRSEKWPRDQIGPLADHVVQYITSSPIQSRTSPPLVEARKLAEQLAARLPEDHAQRIRQALGDLAVRVIEIRTVRDQMAYDMTQFAVAAGKPVEIVLVNNDIQPHNLVLLKPGSMVQVGTFIDQNTTSAAFAAAGYIPPSDQLLCATRMLEPNAQDRLSFTAPRTPGVYPYICTYPGHWMKMFGRMYVVADLEQYDKDPAGYLARNQLPILDELLIERPIVENYAFETLRPLLARLGEKRPFGRAKKLFTQATCASCHRINGQGGAVGPDLTDVAKRLKPDVILEDIVDPSKRLHEEFQTWMILWNGRPVTGIKKNEDPQAIHLVTNPLISCEPIIIPKDEIDQGQDAVVRLTTSTMPVGLLDRFTRDEVLDVLTYLLASGDASHEWFRE